MGAGSAAADVASLSHSQTSLSTALGPPVSRNSILAEPKAFSPETYSDAFCCFAEDVNRDGRPDVVVGANNGIHLLRDVGPLGRAAWPQSLTACAGKGRQAGKRKARLPVIKRPSKRR